MVHNFQADSATKLVLKDILFSDQDITNFVKNLVN